MGANSHAALRKRGVWYGWIQKVRLFVIGCWFGSRGGRVVVDVRAVYTHQMARNLGIEARADCGQGLALWQTTWCGIMRCPLLFVLLERSSRIR